VSPSRERVGEWLEDMVVDASGAFAIVNPGEGTLGRTAYYYDGGSAPAPGAERRSWSFATRHSASVGLRDYRGRRRGPLTHEVAE
jgi:hypothetical protein